MEHKTGSDSAAITGNETTIDPTTPIGALADFYRAFNGRDLDGLAANWLGHEDVVMDNPIGGITRGWDAIRGVYEKLVSSEGRVSVEFYDYSILQTTDAFVAVGRERGFFRSNTTHIELAIRTSRWFKWVGDRFRQFHHHGSIDDPDVLRRYQNAVHGGGRSEGRRAP